MTIPQIGLGTSQLNTQEGGAAKTFECGPKRRPGASSSIATEANQ